MLNNANIADKAQSPYNVAKCRVVESDEMNNASIADKAQSPYMLQNAKYTDEWDLK